MDDLVCSASFPRLTLLRPESARHRGRGSAITSVLRVDLDNDLVTTQVRRRAGPMYEKYLGQLMPAVDEGLIQDE